MERPINYEQNDRRWANIVYSNHGDKKQTIATSGCGPTCAAMVISEITGKTIYPTETCAWAKQRGYRTDNNGTSWSYFKPQLAAFGIKCGDAISDVTKAIYALNSGKLVIALATKGLWTSSGHYILAYAIRNGKIYINDPNSTAAARECADVGTFKSQCKKFWIVEDDWMVKKSDIKLKIDGVAKTMTAVNVDDENYIRVRDLAPALGYEVGWDSASRTIVLNK